FVGTRLFSHSREVALSRALGMKFHQIFSIMSVEPFLLFVLSGIPGGFMGGFLVMGLFALFGQPRIFGAPFILQIDFTLIIVSYILIFFVMLVIGLLTSFMATHIQISKILKGE
ncbi:MAG: FtsX-like permease family protein, partial [Promethearchaeota archaeon]